MSRELTFRIRQNKKIIGYEWLEDGQWFSCSTEIDFNRDGDRLRKRAGTFFPTQSRVSREQFIGCRDKNGKEIWEGDTVIVPGHYCGDYWNKEEKALVEWDDHSTEFWVSDYVTWEECEVVGNECDNLKLIESTVSAEPVGRKIRV